MAVHEPYEQLQGLVSESRELRAVVSKKLQGQASLIQDLAERIRAIRRRLSTFRLQEGPVAVVAGSSCGENEALINRQPVPVGNIPITAVEVMTSVPRPAHASPPPREMITSTDMPEVKPIVSMPQSNNLSDATLMNSAAVTGGSSLPPELMGGNPICINLSNIISTATASSMQPSQTVLSSGLPSMGHPASGISPANALQMSQCGSGINPSMIAELLGSTIGSPGARTILPTSEISQQMQPENQPATATNPSAVYIPMSQQASTSSPSAHSKYVKIWEGDLSGKRQGQHVFITKIEGYRNASASEILTEEWPSRMQIVRLISQDHMNNKQYVGKADFLVFRAMGTHRFLTQLQEKKLCAVIQLPSQTLLLSVSDKACRLIGMLFLEDMVLFKPQISSQEQQQMQQQNQKDKPYSQLEQQQLPSQLQHLQQQHQPLPQLQQQSQMQQPHQPSTQQLQQQPSMLQLQQHPACINCNRNLK